MKFFLLFIAALPLLAAEPDSIKNYTFDEIIVTSNRFETPIDSVPFPVFVLSAEKIEQEIFSNSASLIHTLPGVSVQKTNNGAGSPFLRGLTGNQTLLLFNGMRINNSIFRYGPNQYSALLPITGIKQIEILKGAGSVLYGSDALTGAINYIPRFADISLITDTKFSLTSSYKVHEKSKNIGADFSHQAPGYGLYASGYFNDYENTFAGGNAGEQNPSGFNESAYYISAVIPTGSYKFRLINNYLKQDNVNRYDQLAQRGYSTYKFNPIINQMLIAEVLNDNFKLSSLYANNFEEREYRKNNSLVITNEKDEISTWGVKGDLLSCIGSFKITSGFDFYFDKVLSTTLIINDSSKISTSKRGLYPDNSTAYYGSIYSQVIWQLNNVILSGGIRINYHRNKIYDKQFNDVNLEKIFPSAELSMLWKMNNNFTIKTVLGSAYRAPNINDLSTFGFFDLGVEIPNPELNPETSYNFTTEAEYKNESGRYTASVFYSSLNDLLLRKPALLNGQSFLDDQAVFKKVNAGSAYLYGVEFYFQQFISPDLLIASSASYALGYYTTLKEPLRRIPPITGMTELLFNLNENISINLNFLYASKQDKLSSEDKKDHRIPSGGTPGYFTAGAGVSFIFNCIIIKTEFANIFNQLYKIHGSGIYEPGRDFTIYLKIPVYK